MAMQGYDKNQMYDILVYFEFGFDLHIKYFFDVYTKYNLIHKEHL